MPYLEEVPMLKKPNAPLVALLLVLAAVPASAHEHAHHHHAAPAAKKLTLNAGQPWPTDAPLRQAMGRIRQALAGELPQIHAQRLDAAAYAVLARTVEAEVGNIVADCRLEPAADAQLHLIVADLLAGSRQMAGKKQRQAGAVKVVQALNNYATYFADPGFSRLDH